MRTPINCIILIALMSIPVCCGAQARQGQARVDSLLAELPGITRDSDGVQLLISISDDYAEIDPDKGLQYASGALALSKKIGWRRGEGKAHNCFGLNYDSKSNYAAALGAYFKALSIAEATGNSEGIHEACGNIGVTYGSLDNHSGALEYLFRSLRMSEALADSQSLRVDLSNIGVIYGQQKKPEKAVHYLLKSLAIAERIGDLEGIIVITGNLGNNISDLPLAISYYTKAVRLAKEIGDLQSVAVYTGNIGHAYYELASGTAAHMPDSLATLGRSGLLARAVTFLNAAITACRRIQYIESLAGNLDGLTDALALQGNYKSALSTHRQYSALIDSLYNVENNEKIANLETRRAIELKDKDIEIARLKKRNERILFGAGIAVLLLIMGILFNSFRKQQRSNNLLSKEKKRSDDLLLNILPAEVAEELKERGSANAKQYDEVSVLFTDFVDFTSSAEHLLPQQVVSELDECFTAFDAIIERNGLEKIKTIGDAYMAVCGLPTADPQHARRTVQAALEIGDFIEERRRTAKGFQIRIGINSGPVVAGIVGVKKFAYDIWGDTVNTASRMEQNSLPGRINISHSTYELVKNDFRCAYRGKIAAKNKGEIEMYFVEFRIN